MTDPLTPATQDYLKTIYLLTEENGRFATTSDLAERLNIRPASITGKLQKLAQANPPLINYMKHKGVNLTAVGRCEALRVVRRHRLVEQFLVEKLGYRWDEVHEEAEQLEHALAPQTVQRICEVLGNPQHNPHGRRIPSAELALESRTAVSLPNAPRNQPLTVRYVQDDDEQVLQQLAKLGVRPGVQITAVTHHRKLQIQINDNPTHIPLSSSVADRIFIKNPIQELEQ